MQEPPTVTILDWILKRIEERGGGLRDMTADDAVKLIGDDPELTNAQKAALLSRDPLRIRAVIEYELGYELDELMIHTGPIYFVVPFPMHF